MQADRGAPSFWGEKSVFKITPKKILRPDLNGLRLQHPGEPGVYLIDEGAKRHIADRGTFMAVFGNWHGIVSSSDLNDIDTGRPLAPGTALLQAFGDSRIFLVDEGKKRHILSPEAMDRYDFAWDKVQRVGPGIVEAIASGMDIAWP